MLKFIKELSEMNMKMKSDVTISNQYKSAVNVTLIKTMVFAGIAIYLNHLKEGADIERSVYMTKIAHERAEKTLFNVEMDKSK